MNIEVVDRLGVSIPPTPGSIIAAGALGAPPVNSPAGSGWVTG